MSKVKEQALEALEGLQSDKYRKYLSIKLIATLAGSAILVWLCRHDIASIVWALTVLWSVFLATRCAHDVVQELCKASVKRAFIEAVSKDGKFDENDAAIVDKNNKA